MEFNQYILCENLNELIYIYNYYINKKYKYREPRKWYCWTGVIEDTKEEWFPYFFEINNKDFWIFHFPKNCDIYKSDYIYAKFFIKLQRQQKINKINEE